MKKISITFLLTSVIALTSFAAAARVDPNDQQAVFSATTVQKDIFKKLTKYEGPNIIQPGQLFIRAWKYDATGKTNFQIYVSDYYMGEWRFYHSAHDSNGNALNTTQISRDIISCRSRPCTHEEHLGLNVTQQYLEKNQESGILFKLSGKVGENIFSLPGSYIKAVLLAVKHEGAMPAGAFSSTATNTPASVPAATAKTLPSPVPSAKPGTPNLSSLPENAGGVSIRAPGVAENGSVVPVEIILQSPLIPGDSMILAGDGEKALEIKTNGYPVTAVSTRLRLGTGKISAYAIRSNGHIDSITQTIQIGVPAPSPAAHGNSSTEYRLRTTGQEVKLLLQNDMAITGHIGEITIRPDDGAPILVTFTPRISKNPYLGVTSSNSFDTATVTVNTKAP